MSKPRAERKTTPTLTEEVYMSLIVKHHNALDVRINAEQIYSEIRKTKWNIMHSLAFQGLDLSRFGKDKIQHIQKKWIDDGDAVYEKKNLRLIRIPKQIRNAEKILGLITDNWEESKWLVHHKQTLNTYMSGYNVEM